MRTPGGRCGAGSEGLWERRSITVSAWSGGCPNRSEVENMELQGC